MHSIVFSTRIHASALAKLFLENNRSLCAYLRVRVASQHEAEDIAQEAYARLLQHDQPRAISFLRAYLFKVAANIASDRARQRRLHSRIDLARSSEEQIESATPDQQLHAAEQLSMLARALSELPEKYRRAFLLFDPGMGHQSDRRRFGSRRAHGPQLRQSNRSVLQAETGWRDRARRATRVIP